MDVSGSPPDWMLKFRQIGPKAEGESTILDEPDFLRGGKPAGYEPRRFVDKFGSSITPGVTHDKINPRRKDRKAEKKGWTKSNNFPQDRLI